MTATNTETEKIQLSKKHLRKLSELIKQRTGLVISKKKHQTRIKNFVKKRMRERGLTDPENFYEVLSQSEDNEAEITKLINESVVNETFFYRNTDQMEHLEKRIFPEIIRTKNDSSMNSIRILSAGCSNGAEPYSIVMSYLETCRRMNISPDRLNLKVFGIDINTDSLSEARSGHYQTRLVENAPDRIVSRYFERTGDGYCIEKRIKDYVDFQHRNLVKCSPPCNQDLVFNRNVMIYFESSARDKIVQKLHRSLRDHALLVIGNYESFKYYRDYFGKTPWSQDQIFRKLPRQEDKTCDSQQMNEQAPRRDSDDYVSRNNQLTVKLDQMKDPDYKRITFKGTLDQTTSTDGLKKNFNESLTEDREPLVIDLKELSFILKNHLEPLEATLDFILENRGNVFVISSSERLKEWFQQVFNFDKSEFLESFSEELIVEPSQKNDIELDRDTSKLPVSGIDESTNNASKDDDLPDRSPNENVTIQRSGNDFELKLRGALSASDNPQLSQRVKTQITRVINRIKQHPSADTLKINLEGVERFDRKFVRILNRLKSLTQEEPFLIEIIAPDPSIRQTLQRWSTLL